MVEVALPTKPEEKSRAIELAVSAIEKEYGKGAIIDMHQKVGKPIPCVPTGIYGLDYDVLGVGGLPKGRVVEFFGPESAGKSALALKVLASAQCAHGKTAYLDLEHSIDPSWAAKNGVDVQDVLISQPDYGEQALTIAEHLTASGAFDVIVIDSVAALVPKAELDGDMGDSFMGLQARLMSQALRKLTGLVSKTNTILIFVNQIREKLGVQWGSNETTTGGRALKFYASVRLDVRRIATIKDGETPIGNKVKIKAVKNKVAAPYRETEVDLMFDSGFDGDGSLFDAAVKAGVIDKSGAWMSYKGDRLGQGRRNAIDCMREAGLRDEVLAAVREKAEA